MIFHHVSLRVINPLKRSNAAGVNDERIFKRQQSVFYIRK